ncbi:VOC family protein [Streptomyces sp. GQFP]|uniref:VOC family protein n=1 Tax=Streptomyces sp. GQFP TaxID=2907545 RepID=UPI001F332DA0|nr:VOC family protein [Streptomyces sp. GQFP]UIX29737.1 VOC family protein [Streptomyces sp. GQFP]
MLTTDQVPGAPNWVELRTPDMRAASEFYAALFGWERDAEVFRLDGTVVAGVREAEAVVGGWALSFHTRDAEATAGAVTAAGGERAVEAGACVETGVLYVTDPAGVRFGLREPGPAPVLGLVDAPGALWWTQYYTMDVPGAKAFYQAVFAWDGMDVVLERGAACSILSPAGKGLPGAQGALMTTPAEALGITPPASWFEPGARWLPYFTVLDCDTTVDAALARGATLVYPAETQQAIGRQATLLDPWGAAFAVNAGAA